MGQWLEAGGPGVQLVLIDISTLGEHDALMKFYESLKNMVCGKEEVPGISVSEFSEYAKFNPPGVDGRKMVYFVRLKKESDHITLLFLAGNLFFEAFQVNDGAVYLFGNDQISTYEERMVEYERDMAYYNCSQALYLKNVDEAIKNRTYRPRQFIKPKKPSEPRKPYVYECLESYGLDEYINLGIGSSYTPLQTAADKHRSDILMGKKSLEKMFDRILDFRFEDTQTAGEFGCFGAVFISESIRLKAQAIEIVDMFNKGHDRPISKKYCKIHLSWSFASKVRRAGGCPRYEVLIDGVRLNEDEFLKMFWVLKLSDTNIDDDFEKEFLKNNVYDLDKKSLDLDVLVRRFMINYVEASFDDQKPGSSKEVYGSKKSLYLEKFVQSTFNALSSDEVRGATLVVSGDGGYSTNMAIQVIIKMAAANRVRRVWVGQNGLLSTRAVSAVIRKRVGADGSKASGAFILTENSDAPNKVFDIKYNMINGGPASEEFMDKIYENTKKIKDLLIAQHLPVDISVVGVTKFVGPYPKWKFDVDVFDSASDYVKLMKSMFDFQSIQKLVASPQFSFCRDALYGVASILSYDALHGVTGPYAKRIFVEELGVQESSLLNCVPEEDSGGGHLDPSLTYVELVPGMGVGKSQAEQKPPEFGAAADGDADCNMVLGKRSFVTPSDSVAIISANAVESIPYFSSGLTGVARSMPSTSAALDAIAKRLNLKLFEVPTGWKFFGKLMDACSVCGKESFGSGSNHIHEEDDIRTVLAWLSILAYKNKENIGGEKLATVEAIVDQHWVDYGRHYYTRYDYENVNAGEAKAYLVKLQSSLDDINNIVKKIRPDVSNVAIADEFKYKDPVDCSNSKHQGVRYLFEDGSQLVFHLSDSGSEGATIRLYIEHYEKDPSKFGRDSQYALAPLVDVALKLTGLSAPTNISQVENARIFWPICPKCHYIVIYY